MEPPLRVWRPRAHPPSQGDVARWLCSSAAVPAQQSAAVAALSMPQAPAAQLQRLVAAPHTQPQRFGGNQQRQPHVQHQQQQEQPVADQAAHSWIIPQQPAATELQRMFPVAPAQPPVAGTQGWGSRPAYWSGGQHALSGCGAGHSHPTGGAPQLPTSGPLALPAPSQLRSGLADPSVREGSNSPPTRSDAGRQAIVLPPDIHACQPSSHMSGSASWQQKQRQQLQPLLQQPQASVQLSCGGSRGNEGRLPVSGGGPAGEMESSTPTAADLMAFVQQHGLQACSMGTAMQAWREQRQAACHLSSEAAAPAWNWELEEEDEVQQQQQSAPLQQKPPAQQQGLLGSVHEEIFRPPLQAAPAAKAGGAAAAAGGGSRSAQKPSSAQKLKQAVLVAGGRAYAAAKPEQPKSAWERPRSAGALQPLNKPKQQKGRKPAASGSAGKGALAAAAAAAEGVGLGAADPATSGPAACKKQSRLQKRRGSDAKAAAAAPLKPQGSNASHLEAGSAAAPLPAAQIPKRRRVAAAAAAGDAGAAAGKPAASGRAAAASGRAAGAGNRRSVEQLDALAEALDVLPLSGVANVCTPLGFERFARDMGKAASCSIGILLADAQGGQFFSTLEPLTREQQQRIKASAKSAGSGDKKARQSGKGKGAVADPAAAAADSGPSSSSAAKLASAGGGEVVGLCVLPIHLGKEGCGKPVDTLYYVPLAAGTWGGMRVKEEVAQQGRQLAEQLLQAEQSIVAFGMQGVLRLLGEAGVSVPPVSQLAVMDSRLLCWLLEPHLLQDKELSEYGLHELVDRHLGGMPGSGSGTSAAATAAAAGPAAGIAAAPPMQRMRRALLAAITLGEAVHVQLLEGGLSMDVMQREMQVAALLAQMELAGLGFDPWRLAEAGQLARAHMGRLEGEAAGIAGKPFNLASPSQLADVLYTVLKLPPPTSYGRAAAKTHLPTDEAALKQLQHLSPLPGLIIQHRALQNFVSKWVEALWAQAAGGGSDSAEAWAAAHPGAGGWPRVTCAWNQTATATGRLSSSSPNLQAVTNYRLEVAGTGALTNIRDAFVAAHGCTLLSADYSQIELRVLAHLSGDAKLLQLLQHVGAGGDAFTAIASTWLGFGDPLSVSADDRDKAKRVTYGIIYGLTNWGLAQQLNVSVGAAQELISSFLKHFSGVAGWLEATRAAARQHGYVATLAGRRRPIKGLGATDKRMRAEAERKAVNTTVQGTAADIMKAAMLNWSTWMEAQGQPPVRLVAQIHDELLLEVDGTLDVRWVAQELRRVMEGVLQLAVPLLVKMKVGERWGSMAVVG